MFYHGAQNYHKRNPFKIDLRREFFGMPAQLNHFFSDLLELSTRMFVWMKIQL